MNYINFNGKYFTENEVIITAQSRGLRYGDGIFETIKLKSNKLILAEEHFNRLFYGLQMLKFDVGKLFTAQKLETEILELAKKNKLTNARIRLTIIRGEGGIYDAKNHQPNYIIEATTLPQSNGEFNINGLQLCFYDAAKKSVDAFSNLKTNNYLPYFMGALFAQKTHCNDAIIFNTEGNICDSTIANIFYIKHETFYTPALIQGCVAGVMRTWLIQKIQTLGYTVIETSITKTNLLQADEVFLTNSIHNIRWVANIENANYSNIVVKKIVDGLQKSEVEIFC